MGSKSAKPAARLMDIGSDHAGYPPTPIITGSSNVTCNGRPVARQGDMLIPHLRPKSPPHPRAIKEGSASVLVNGKPWARVGDGIDCGGSVSIGSGNVFVGDKPKVSLNAITPPEWEEYMAASMGRFLSEYEEKRLQADLAVKYRGSSGAVATWQQHYVSKLEAGEPVPDTAEVNDPHEKVGLSQARSEYRLATAEAAMEEAFAREPETVDDVVERFAAARAYLEAGGEYEPKYTDDQLLAMAAEGIGGRFLVSLQEIKPTSDTVGYTRADTGRTTMWSTTPDQVERGDSDPELLMDIQGMRGYDPSKKYALYILDQGPDYETDGLFAISPTFEKMQKVGVEEFGDDFDEDLLKAVMTPEYQVDYARAMEALYSQGLNEFKVNELKGFANHNFSGEQDRRKFLTRHIYRTQIGCNKDFMGNGVTKWKGGSQEYGSVELLTVEKKAASIQSLLDDGRLRIAPADPLKKT